MKRHLISLATALLVVSGCADSSSAGPIAPDFARGAAAKAAQRTAASGEFQALVDFSTLTLTPRGKNCRLNVAGQLVFTGTIEGAAVGSTSALVFATCDQVRATPPGTFPDVFKSRLVFEGTIDGEPTRARMIYQGRSAAGGRIDARLLLSGGARGVLDVDAQLAVGGTYEGSLVVR